MDFSYLKQKSSSHLSLRSRKTVALEKLIDADNVFAFFAVILAKSHKESTQLLHKQNSFYDAIIKVFTFFVIGVAQPNKSLLTCQQDFRSFLLLLISLSEV